MGEWLPKVFGRGRLGSGPKSMRDEIDPRPDTPELDAPRPVAEAPEGADSFQFSLWVEQKVGEGEDAEPVLAVSQTRDQGRLSVFDGMGGAGSTRYTFNGISRTGAYIAARLASEVVEAFFRNPTAEAYFTSKAVAEAAARALEAGLLERFRTELARLDAAPSRLGGKMMRRLPTTMTCLSYKVIEGYKAAGYAVHWAGDSRAYVLSPSDGLQQISMDDLKSGGDALQNLLEDSPVSNCVNADVSFTINTASGMCQLPLTFLVATDGCFNFCPTPAHFEHALLDSLLNSSNSFEWRDDLTKRLHAIAGDDLSLALVSIGWPTFGDMRKDYRRRSAEVLEAFVKPIDDLDGVIRDLACRHKRGINDRDKLRSDLWSRYKKGYELFCRDVQGGGGQP